MDSIKTQKLEAMKNYKKAQFLYNLIVYSLTAFLSILFYLYLFWFPSMRHFFSIFLPNIYSFTLSPKFLFILGNVIVLFLVGESKLGGGGGSQYSSPAAEIYDEYVQRSQSLRERYMRVEYKKKDRKILEMHTSIRKWMSVDAMSVYDLKDEKKKEIGLITNKNCEAAVVKVDPVEGKIGGGGAEEELKLTVLQEEEEEEEELKHTVLPKDELNRRVEEFIARVSRQRRLEERQELDRW